MRIRVVSFGKVKQPFIREGEAEYLKRLQSECQFEIQEIDNSRFGNLPVETQRLKEADLLNESVKAGEVLIALDEIGKQFTSPELSRWIDSQCSSGRSNFCFAIGGPHGWDEQVRKRAALVLSLSKLTFPYQLARLLVVEQLYRALSISKGYPYHK